MFTPHDLHPRSRQLGRIPFPSLTPWADPNVSSSSPPLGTPSPIHLATPVLPRLGPRPLQPQQTVNYGESRTGSHQGGGPGATQSASTHKSRLGSETPASPWLWPSRTPAESSQRDSARKSPSLASLPKPSASLQDSRDRDRGKSGLLNSLHAHSSARRMLHNAPTAMSPSLPKAARADPALVNFAITEGRARLGSPLLRADSTAELSVDGLSLQSGTLQLPTPMLQGVQQQATTGAAAGTSMAQTEVQMGARRKPMPVNSPRLTAAQPSWLTSAQQPPASTEKAQASTGSAWSPMQPAQKRGLQPLGAGKLRVLSAAPPPNKQEEAEAPSQPASVSSTDTPPLQTSISAQPALSGNLRSAKGRSKERLEELQEILRQLGALVLPQPSHPAPVRAFEGVPLKGASSDGGWARERLEQLRDLQAEAADSLVVRQEHQVADSGGAALAKVLSVSARPEARRTALLNIVTQPALRQRQSRGADGGSDRDGGRPAARAQCAQAEGLLERLRRLQALQSEAAQLLVP